MPDDIQSKKGANGTPSDIWSVMAKQCPADAVRMKHCRGCNHLKATDKRCYTAYCAYLDDTGHRRPCKFGTDPCLGKELIQGFEEPTVSQHSSEVQSAANRVRKKPAQPKVKRRPGRKTNWDSEYAEKLYLTGEYYLFEIAEIVGCEQKQISNFAFNHMWTLERHEQLSKVAKVRHDLEVEKAKYEEWKKNKNSNQTAEQKG